jgi:hypothetical protein
MYFQREQGAELIAAIARRSRRFVDSTSPAKIKQMPRRLPDRESSAASRLWSCSTEERARQSA